MAAAAAGDGLHLDYERVVHTATLPAHRLIAVASDLHTDATTFRVGRVQVQVASLAAVIWSKTAAGRGKDLDALPELYRLAGISNTDKSAVDAPRRSAPELAQAGYLEPVQPVTAQELAQAHIDAARRQAAASRAGHQQPPTQR